ncbi:MAG: hypothetical protein ACOVNR_00015, partial [Chitinophagaceae bacterium]
KLFKYFCYMIAKCTIKKGVVALGSVIIGLHMVFASSIFSGTTDESGKYKRYSLSNLNSRFARKSISLYSLKSSLTFRGSSFSLNDSPLPSASNEFRSIMQYERGNTTYILPYKVKIQVPRFKTPSPPTHP